MSDELLVCRTRLPRTPMQLAIDSPLDDKLKFVGQIGNWQSEIGNDMLNSPRLKH
jgi:hypothetical protein